MQSKILIIDDDREVVNSLTTLLELHGYIVYSSTSAHEALQFVERTHPDVIVLDWQMPEMSGIEFMHELERRSTTSRSYILMVSGKTAVDDIVKGLDSGADDYLPKPFRPEELLARIRVGIRIRELENRISEEAQKTALLQMALSVADSIGNPIAAAKLYIESLLHQHSIEEKPEVKKAIETIYILLKDALNLMTKYQSITSTQAIPPPAGGHTSTKHNNHS